MQEQLLSMEEVEGRAICKGEGEEGEETSLHRVWKVMILDGGTREVLKRSWKHWQEGKRPLTC